MPEVSNPPIVGTPPWMPANPDPTALTREASGLLREEMYRAITALRELLESRLETLDASVTDFHARFPPEVKERITSAADLVVERLNTLRMESDQKFDAIRLQLVERDVRTDQARESSKTAIDAAFLANQKMADSNAEANDKAIAKSESATKEKIDGLQALLTGLLTGSINDIRGQINALTSRLDRGEGADKGHVDSRSERAQSTSMIVGISTLAALVISMIVGAVIFIAVRPVSAPAPAPAQYGYSAPPTVVSPAVVPVQPSK